MSKLNQETWARIFPWLEKAQEVPAGELDTWLEKLIAEQPDVGVPLRTVLQHSWGAETKDFLALPLKAAGGSRVGQRVGAYTIELLLGQGGMGEVWRGRRNDGRFTAHYAIKFLWLAAKGAPAERFHREGRLLARLTHPNIARLIDAGTLPNGESYLILEYVEGEHIDAYCQANSLGLRERLDLFFKVLVAVAHAHANLVIHRDIKPSNVMVTADGEVKLLDFGIAKLVGGTLDEEQEPQTRIEDIALTPEFAAPEQVLGEPPTTSTDVYQLGVLLYLLLTGEFPFATGGAKRAEQVRAALDAVPPRMSQRVDGSARKWLRGDLDAIVDKALRKKPEERYVTAAALADDLRRHLADEPVGARDGLFSYRAGKFVRRYRGAVVGTAAAVLALAIAAGFALVQAHEAQTQRNAAVFNEKRVEAENEFLFEIMSSVRSDGTPLTSASILEEGVKMLDTQYANEPAFRVVMYLQLASRYGDPRDLTSAFAIVTKAQALARQIDDPELISESECSGVEPLWDMGRTDEAAQQLKLGQAALARTRNSPAKATVLCMDANATVLAAQGNTAAAIDKLKQVIAFMEKIGETHGLGYIDELNHLGFYYHDMGDTRNTFEITQRTVQAFDSVGRAQTQDAITSQHNLAMSLVAFGEVRTAFAVEAKAVARASADGRPVGADLSNGFGDMAIRLNQPEAALKSYDAGYAVAGQRSDFARKLGALLGRARAHIALGRLVDAEQDMKELSALLPGQEVAYPRAYAQSKEVTVRLLQAQGRLDEAWRQGRALIDELRNAKDSSHGMLAAALSATIRVGIADHHFAAAEPLADEALAIYRQQARNPDASGDVGQALLLLAQVQLGLGRTEQAKRLARSAVTPLDAGLGADHPLTLMAVELAATKTS